MNQNEGAILLHSCAKRVLEAFVVGFEAGFKACALGEKLDEALARVRKNLNLIQGDLT